VRALPLTGSCGRRESRQGHHRWHPHLPTIRDLPASTVR
jgi:hypothetical protein